MYIILRYVFTGHCSLNSCIHLRKIANISENKTAYKYTDTIWRVCFSLYVYEGMFPLIQYIDYIK